jgi:hypothetical protein
MSYPENCLRGLSSKDMLQEDGTIAGHAFYFTKVDNRTDGCQELSINWQDDDKTIEFTINQTSPRGGLQFKYGVAVLPLAALNKICKQLTLIAGLVSYERKPTEENPYHGNILLRESVSPHTMKSIAGTLATHVMQVVKSQGE